MGIISNELAAKIKSLQDHEKIEFVDSILIQLDKPDFEIGRVLAQYYGLTAEELYFIINSDIKYRWDGRVKTKYYA